MDNTYTKDSVIPEKVSPMTEESVLSADTALVPSPAEEIPSAEPSADIPLPAEGKIREKLRLILMLAATLIATLAVIVYGYKISLISKKLPPPLSEHFLS